MTFPCYPKYRASGVEWLDQVPDHWSSVPIKYMALERNSLFLDGDWIESKDISSDGIRYITTGNVGEGAYKEQGAGFISEETFHALRCTEVYEGDVLVSRLNNPIGRACVVPNLGGRVVTSVDNVIFRPDLKFYKKFIVYLFSSEEYFKHTSNLARGATMQRISRGLLGNIRVVTPSLEEQTQIARFLDHETARIDALIEEQQRLIELLKEKRQAVISHAVTKGLDPTVPMKDSGVEWLGEVPAHWEVRSISSISKKITNGYVGPTRDILVDEPGVRYLQSLHIKSNKIKFEVPYFVSEQWSAEHAKSILASGDVLIVQTGDIGQVAVVTEEHAGCNCHALIIVSPVREVVLGEWVSWVLNSTYGYHSLLSIQTGAMHPHLNCGNVKFLNLPIPPLEEQARIVSFIESGELEMDSLMSETKRSLLLLQERRTALISAAVTGKIDVRGWQPPASTQAPEPAVAEAD
ncbi:restriction endonuclease subunit S [Pseudomonas aeruginosa]|uniref:Type I restriction-modification system, S subunit n=1 Tax=Pseudomonas paraeruginosa (strain DSM 24068 / PA7) TaxID=381754 RepID=A6UXD7_PSEP7|nr:MULTISPECIES: restriction endonuclease subunit S [Pseudomonadaceae]ABR82006.1 type I restriction-modification system, S subunit [Pseudomonas aeruginosa PA7]ASA26721.1 restriction endonuclease subunit S [Pseudomonas aeruginosa]ASD01063.1 restriction endonuclease subunit S [Pseudomonas aeruginosa]EIU1300406.1 restriction endonuclease subunit S [Pseudomonas aeruginosa]EIU2577497.1 restriction endonuclease subunit S [Pseudomonas aeruginosa]